MSRDFCAELKPSVSERPIDLGALPPPDLDEAGYLFGGRDTEPCNKTARGTFRVTAYCGRFW
jgi:hypothetical protein